MTEFDLRRYIAKETTIGIVINTLVSMVPSFIFINSASVTIFGPVRDIGARLTPQFFMAAFMSALVPLMLTCRRQAKGRLGIGCSTPRFRPSWAFMISVGLGAAFTILTFAVIHIVIAPLAVRGVGAGALLALCAAQAALAAATVTPVAIVLLFRTAGHARA